MVWASFALAVARLPRGSTRVEVARAAHVAAAPVVLVLLVSAFLSRDTTAFTSDVVVVPAGLAVGLSLSGILLLVTLWRRLGLRRSGQEPAP